MNHSQVTQTQAEISRWVGFELASQAFALRIGCVREVVPSASFEPVPGAPPFVLGVSALRGRILPVIDLHGRLQIDSAMAINKASNCLIVVDVAGESLALRVDRIGQLYAFEAGRIKTAPSVSAPGTDDAVSGMVVFDDSMLSLLDVNALVDPIGPVIQ